VKPLTPTPPFALTGFTVPDLLIVLGWLAGALGLALMYPKVAAEHCKQYPDPETARAARHPFLLLIMALIALTWPVSVPGMLLVGRVLRR
jgi:hypothetical protein